MLLRVIQLTYDTGLLSYIRQGQNHFDGIQFVFGNKGMHGFAPIFSKAKGLHNFITFSTVICFYRFRENIFQQFDQIKRILSLNKILLN